MPENWNPIAAPPMAGAPRPSPKTGQITFASIGQRGLIGVSGP